MNKKDGAPFKGPESQTPQEIAAQVAEREVTQTLVIPGPKPGEAAQVAEWKRASIIANAEIFANRSEFSKYDPWTVEEMIG